jgi:Protein of unknown function (DUF4199)
MVTNPKALIGIGLTAGVAQVVAGISMYLAGVYFAPWSIVVSLAVLLLSIVVGTRWYTAHCLNGEITYMQAVGVGIVVSVSTGVVYAVYNIVSISFFYPHFLDELVQLRIAYAVAHQLAHQSFTALRAEVTAPAIAIPNFIRLSVAGTLLSLLSSLFLKRRR